MAPPRIGAPEEPELLQGQPSAKTQWRAARRVEGEIRDRDPGPIDQGHGKPMVRGAKPCGARLSVAPRMIRRKKMRRPFRRRSRPAGNSAGNGRVAVGGEAAGDEAPACGDEIEHPAPRIPPMTWAAM